MKNSFLLLIVTSFTTCSLAQVCPIEWCDDYKNNREVLYVSQIQEDGFVSYDREISPNVSHFYYNTLDECASTSQLLKGHDPSHAIEIRNEFYTLSLISMSNSETLEIHKVDPAKNNEILEVFKIKLPLEKKAIVRTRRTIISNGVIQVVFTGAIPGKSKFISLYSISKDDLRTLKSSITVILEGSSASCEIFDHWYDSKNEEVGVAYTVSENNHESVYLGSLNDTIWGNSIIHSFNQEKLVQNLTAVGQLSETPIFLQILYSTADKSNPLAIKNVSFQGNELDDFKYSMENLTRELSIEEKKAVEASMNKGELPSRWNASGSYYKEYNTSELSTDAGYITVHHSEASSRSSSLFENDFFVVYSKLDGSIVLAKMIDFADSESGFNIYMLKGDFYMFFNDDSGWYNEQGIYSKNAASTKTNKKRPVFYQFNLTNGASYRGIIPTTQTHDKLSTMFEFNFEVVILLYSDEYKSTRLGKLK